MDFERLKVSREPNECHGFSDESRSSKIVSKYSISNFMGNNKKKLELLMAQYQTQ